LSVNELVEMIEKDDFLEFAEKFGELGRNEKKSLKERLDLKEILGMARDFESLEPDEVNKLAFEVAVVSVVEDLKTSQIRKILNMSRATYVKAKQRKDDISVDKAKMRYILAYTSSRHRGARLIAEVADKIIPGLNPENYERFHDFLQAVVAYHKLLGGKD